MKAYIVNGEPISSEQLQILQLEATVRLLQAVIVQSGVNDTEVNLNERRLNMAGITFNYDESPFNNAVTVSWRRSVAVN